MFWVPMLISLALMIIGYLLQPKPKAAKPDMASEMDSPTAEAGRPVTVLFGEITVKSPNFLWFGDKYYVQRSARTSKK